MAINEPVSLDSQLDSIIDGKAISPSISLEDLTYGHVLDVANALKSKRRYDQALPDRYVYVCVLELIGVSQDCVDEPNFMKKVRDSKKRMANNAKTKSKREMKDKQERDRPFNLLVRNSVVNLDVQSDAENVMNVGAGVENELNVVNPDMNECAQCDQWKQKFHSCEKEKVDLESKVSGLEKKHDQNVREIESLVSDTVTLKNEVSRLTHEVASLKPHNIKRKIGRRDEKIKKLDQDIEKLNADLVAKGEYGDRVIGDMKEQLSVMKEVVQRMEEQSEFEKSKLAADYEKWAIEKSKLLEKIESLRKSRWYYSKKEIKMDEAQRVKVRELNDRVKELENENSELREKIEEFLESKVVQCFVNGKYKEDVRRVYHELLSMGASANQCKNIVTTVLNGFGVSVDRLPKATCAKRMALECRALACLQLGEVLQTGENMTLLSDGTSKWGHGYETMSVQMSDGKVYVLGLRDVSNGSAESKLQLLRVVLQDVYELGLYDNVSEWVKQIIVKLKNTMSDRAMNEKKFNVMLSEFRREILPDVMRGWKEMSVKERESCGRMNHFFCTMHLLIGLADQSDATLRVWENLVFGTEEVGANAVCGMKAGQSESGAVRTERTVCKAVQERGCERSGKPVYFGAYVKQEFGHQKIPLQPFIGNRFNIVFENGAGVYFLKDEILAFMSEMKDENQLMKAVHADMSVNQYLAGIRALGLVERMITTPLQKVFERKEHVYGLKAQFARLSECLKRWSADASELLAGTGRVFVDVAVENDEVFQRLIQECELDEMTKQVLELLCAGYDTKIKSMMDGELTEDMFENMSETESVPRNNVLSERNFGMLDYWMRAKPSAYTCVHEGLLMFKQNGTKEWMRGLSEVQLKEACEKARKSVDEQTKMHVERQAVISAEKAEKVVTMKRERERKERMQRDRSEQMTVSLEGCNGFWKNETEMNAWFEANVGDDVRMCALEAQLKFRKFVLKAKNVDGCLNVTRGRKTKNVHELEACLRKAMNEREVERETVGLSEELQNKLVSKEDIDIEKKRLCEEPKAKKPKIDRAKVPYVKSLDELVGVRIEFLNERKVWKRGTVLSVDEKKDYMSSVRFDGEEESELNVKEHLRTGRVRLPELHVKDLLGKRVRQRFMDEDSEREIWWDGTVVKVKNERLLNPVFLVTCDDDEDASAEYEIKLYEDYAMGDLQLL